MDMVGFKVRLWDRSRRIWRCLASLRRRLQLGLDDGCQYKSKKRRSLGLRCAYLTAEEKTRISKGLVSRDTVRITGLAIPRSNRNNETIHHACSSNYIICVRKTFRR